MGGWALVEQGVVMSYGVGLWGWVEVPQVVAQLWTLRSRVMWGEVCSSQILRTERSEKVLTFSWGWWTLLHHVGRKSPSRLWSKRQLHPSFRILQPDSFHRLNTHLLTKRNQKNNSKVNHSTTSSMISFRRILPNANLSSTNWRKRKRMIQHMPSFWGFLSSNIRGCPTHSREETDRDPVYSWTTLIIKKALT